MKTTSRLESHPDVDKSVNILNQNKDQQD